MNRLTILVGSLCLMISNSLLSQNTFPTSGNVGINTASPSARLDVNGNMKVDSCLMVKDSLIVDKDSRTKGDFKVEGEAYFLQAVYMNDKLVVESKLEVSDKITATENILSDQNIKAGNNIRAGNNVRADNNANISNNANVGNKLNVSGNSTFSGTVKMNALPSLNNLNNPNLEFLIKTPSGELKTFNKNSLVPLVLDQEYEPVVCVPGDILDPKWSNGTNKIYVACPQVKVGIGTSSPNFQLHVTAMTYTRKLLVGH